MAQLSYTAFSQSLFCSLANISKEASGKTFTRCLLQQMRMLLQKVPMHITSSTLRFYFICRTVICCWSIPTNTSTKRRPIHLLLQLLCYRDPASVSAARTISSPAYWWSPGTFSWRCSEQTSVQHPSSLKVLLLGQGLGSTQAPNKPTHKYLRRTGCTSGWDSK